MTALDVITAIASTATAIGVIIAVVQLWHAEKLAKAEFEDQFRRDYREICKDLPVKAFLGHQLSPEELEGSLSVFHQYFHLCNSQIFLRSQNKISDPTWKMWASGIEANLELEAFAQAWEFIHTEATKHRLEYLACFCDTKQDPKQIGSEYKFHQNTIEDGESS